jgi:hypothetical protein
MFLISLNGNIPSSGLDGMNANEITIRRENTINNGC